MFAAAFSNQPVKRLTGKQSYHSLLGSHRLQHLGPQIRDILHELGQAIPNDQGGGPFFYQQDLTALSDFFLTLPAS